MFSLWIIEEILVIFVGGMMVVMMMFCLWIWLKLVKGVGDGWSHWWFGMYLVKCILVKLVYMIQLIGIVSIVIITLYLYSCFSLLVIWLLPCFDYNLLQGGFMFLKIFFINFFFFLIFVIHKQTRSKFVVIKEHFFSLLYLIMCKKYLSLWHANKRMIGLFFFYVDSVFWIEYVTFHSVIFIVRFFFFFWGH